MAGKIALFFGTENKGLSGEVLKNSDAFLKIPTDGFTESLNISVSAAILLQHLSTDVRNSDVDWKLTAEEILEKRLDWSKKAIESIDDILLRYHLNTQ